MRRNSGPGLDTFAIAGISLGGPIGIRAAVRHPDCESPNPFTSQLVSLLTGRQAGPAARCDPVVDREVDPSSYRRF
jgi:pimeloyl-ACP methyl ester carboxylesterase